MISLPCVVQPCKLCLHPSFRVTETLGSRPRVHIVKQKVNVVNSIAENTSSLTIMCHSKHHLQHIDLIACQWTSDACLFLAWYLVGPCVFLASSAQLSALF